MESPPSRSVSRSASWCLFGQRVPRSEIVFFCQVFVIYTVIVFAAYNLTVGNGDSNLWTALLSSCLGYLLPNPTIRVNHAADTPQ
jgi:hypothetical protein